MERLNEMDSESHFRLLVSYADESFSDEPLRSLPARIPSMLFLFGGIIHPIFRENVQPVIIRNVGRYSGIPSAFDP
jgi:hypothetical protein